MGDYMRGVQDTVEYILIMTKECKDLKELKTKLEELLSDIIEKKYMNLKKIFKLSVP